MDAATVGENKTELVSRFKSDRDSARERKRESVRVAVMRFV